MYYKICFFPDSVSAIILSHQMCVALWNKKIMNRDMVNVWVLAVNDFEMCSMKSIVGAWFC
jgi:hypothetical protein